MNPSPSTITPHSVEQTAASQHPKYSRQNFSKPHYISTNSAHSILERAERQCLKQQAAAGRCKSPLEYEEQRLHSWEMTEQSITSVFFLLWFAGVLLLAANHVLCTWDVAAPSSPLIALVGVACVFLVYARATKTVPTEQTVMLSGRTTLWSRAVSLGW
jgi:hypothetical protein